MIVLLPTYIVIMLKTIYLILYCEIQYFRKLTSNVGKPVINKALILFWL